MIQQLATKYRKPIAALTALLFYTGMVLPAYGMVNFRQTVVAGTYSIAGNTVPKRFSPIYGFMDPGKQYRHSAAANRASTAGIPGTIQRENKDKMDIDGPGQPEMASFKPAGTNDMVNLFTGDFSYNIPLLDVGGYPVNIYYDGGITMEQSASWVGLGWNINPGNVNRNMRGVPDDFNGEELIKQELKTKPNITWGVRFGADYELGGIKNLSFSGGVKLGVSFNNYLGPSLEAGLKGGTAITVPKKAMGEKSAGDNETFRSLSFGVSADATVSSRYGMTLSPNVSLTSRIFNEVSTYSKGIGLSTSYNSRTGIKGMHIAAQESFNSLSVRNFHNRELEKFSDGTRSATLLSSSISFAKPTYIPSMRTINTNSAWAGHFQFGTGIFGNYGSVETEVYKQQSEISNGDVTQRRPMVGFLYLKNAVDNRDAVMDFSRVNDQEVTPQTPIISAPQYAYDVFAIQGEGISGTIRLARNDIGYMRDNYTVSKEKSFGVGADVGIPGHYGGNFNIISTPSSIGEWNDGNLLKITNRFSGNEKDKESVYFKNPGESVVISAGQYEKIGGTDLVRFKLGGSKLRPTIEPVLERFDKGNRKTGEVSVAGDAAGRNKRTQVVSYLTAAECDTIGLDRKIKVYDPVTLLNQENELNFSTIDRVSADRKKNHISQINVTEADGKRYVYGIPVYNLTQKEYTFTVDGTNQEPDQVSFQPNEISLTESPHLSGNGKDGYVQVTSTPAYSHSFLLTGLLSPDYVDVNGDGITEDDLGGAIKMNYTKFSNHRWRTPHTANQLANFNAGKKTEIKDDKGIIVYGERESWYLHSIESKTMIAFFKVTDRQDGKGVINEMGGINSSDNSQKKLERIDLYNKADLKKNGIAAAKPVKTVHFEYSYYLCDNTPDNPSGNGKLTLDRIWFTYNGQKENSLQKNQYKFSYTATSVAATGENPEYELNAADRWGNYKPNVPNPGSLRNKDYPYSLQTKITADQYAQAWALKRILLPSGGQIEVEYESDDYAYVQNKRAAQMMEVIGFGNTNSSLSNELYTISAGNITENDFVFIKVPVACANTSDVYYKYLQGVSQLSFKLTVNMPKGPEMIPCYSEIENYGIYTNAGFPAIWVKMKKMAGYSPLSLTAIEFLREQLPGQAFPGYDVSESTGIEQVGRMLAGIIDGLSSAFKDIPKYLRSAGKAQTADLTRSFVRLNNPAGFKYGGGQRVKTVKLKDNWKKMTNPGQPAEGYSSVYGQQYEYTTREVLNGVERTISSGVASYEPSIGGEENPFQMIERVVNNLPLGPASYGAIEKPVLDAFFQAPVVGYSKVTVTSIGKKQNPAPATNKTRSAVGRQVTEFYTAKDYPVYYNYTSFDNGSDKEFHLSSLTVFWLKFALDSRALSQGFVVALNDMHGKLRSQSSYAENDPATRINYTENFYRNTGAKGLAEKFDFVHQSSAGEIKEDNMGIDIELMVDTREFSVKGKSFEVQGQLDLFPVLAPVWLPFVWPVVGMSEDTYRAVTTTKVINYHAVLDSVLVIDKGSAVRTKNLLYDAETGQVLVTRTNNEFEKPVYTVNYPAYWAYSGMGPAYKNIDAVYTGVDFLDGKIMAGMTATEIKTIFESGDELYVFDPGSDAGCDPVMASSADRGIIWALDKSKNSSSLTTSNPDFIFIDKQGKPYSRTGVKFRIVRSGKRNMLGAPVAGAVTMVSPVKYITATERKLVVENSSKVINASAVEYKEKWQTDNDVFYKFKTVVDPVTCVATEQPDCEGYLEKGINPYRKGLLGNFKGHRNLIFYGERAETVPTGGTNLSQNGFLTGFSTYWNFNAENNLVPDIANTKWVWNTEATRFNSKGMELETKDALGIYTAAQYGYSKTLPVAIANNSRSYEMMYEGFEDYGYDDLLNNSVYNTCAERHIDFSGIENTQIINANQAGFNAHSGKQVLQVSATSTKSIPAGSTVAESFPLSYQQATVESIIGAGQNFYRVASDGVGNTGVQIPNNTYAVGINDVVALGFGYNPDYTMSFYLKANTTTSFPFDSYVSENGGSYDISVSLVTDLSSQPTLLYSYSQAAGQGSPSHLTYTYNSFNIQMCAGKFYYIEIVYHPIPLFITPPYYWPPGSSSFWCGINYYSSGLTAYENLTTQSGVCNYTKPLPASVAMMNPLFSIPSGKKMVFSAWVRESNTQVSTYTNNEVQIDFGAGNSNNVTIKPSGPVIEGWQRYEGYFTAPAGVSSMDLKLVNNSGSAIYFDDIRIHPFNANMKSYVYDPVNLRLRSELDANNYASYYEYDEEGTLIRTKAETRQGIKTITESRSAKQKNISDFQ